MTDQSITIVIVGDTFVGKTNLIFSFAEDQFIEEYAQTISDDWSCKEITFRYEHTKSIQVNLSLWDLGGHAECSKIRKLAYKKADAILVCFSLAELDVMSNQKGEKNQIC